MIRLGSNIMSDKLKIWFNSYPSGNNNVGHKTCKFYVKINGLIVHEGEQVSSFYYCKSSTSAGNKTANAWITTHITMYL